VFDSLGFASRQNEIYLFEIEIRIGPDTFSFERRSSPADQQLLLFRDGGP